MSVVTIVLIAILVVGVALGLYAWLAPRRSEQPRAPREDALFVNTGWTRDVDDEFKSLSESARCDLVFTVSALDDDRSQQLLGHALYDPSESVALAAAHALANSGRRPVVEAFMREHPGARAERIAETLTLLD